MRGLMKPISIILVATFTVSACGKTEPQKPAEGLSEASIIAAIDQRPSMQLGQRSTAMPAQSFVREIELIVHNRVDGEFISCGYARLPHAYYADGRPMEIEPPHAFVAQGQNVYLAEDLPGSEFADLQARVCGPNWVPPVPSPPSAR